MAAPSGLEGSSERMKSGGPCPAGRSMPSARAVRRSLVTAYSRAGGSVRRIPTLHVTMTDAAAKPVSRESWAFQDSTGSMSRYSRSQRSSWTSISCASIRKDTPPRSASWARSRASFATYEGALDRGRRGLPRRRAGWSTAPTGSIVRNSRLVRSLPGWTRRCLLDRGRETRREVLLLLDGQHAPWRSSSAGERPPWATPASRLARC